MHYVIWMDDLYMYVMDYMMMYDVLLYDEHDMH